ncbi:cupin domain-containing protein [Viridibacillus sp. YIM B01967]|uniref:Cupin domain-containing protein n=1 Tax=Viridibacillus soli TaxID=2798301 RepID=A0ABS1H245_9BACL|nr:cupin domain-containing protein [Viridibacillus soli]MBK3493470.1 cupin domain-containing protein [Viridibacillus soli]
MANSDMDFTKPDVEFFFDINKNRLFTRNNENFINSLGRNNLNTLGNVSLFDIFLSKDRIIEPHYHQNASELVYCISGSAVVSLINPFTNKVSHIPITPGQVANIPQGWWHWEIGTKENTHLLAIFDAPYPESILGSDLLTKTPIEVLAYAYCLDLNQLKKTLAPLNNETILIGPTDNCGAQPENINIEQPSDPMSNYHPYYNAVQNPYYYGGGH